MKGFVCEICEKNTLRRVELKNGKKVCEHCNEQLQIKNVLDIEVPDVVKWVGKVAKQGDLKMFIIPQTQRVFLKHKEKYIIVVRKLE